MIHKETGLLSAKEISKADLLSFFGRVSVKSSSTLSKIVTNLPGKTGLLAFFEASTRTRVSFEKAGLDLGIRWMHLNPSELSLQKGETMKDTFETLKQYSPDFLVVRHSLSGFCEFVSRWTKIPCINAGDGQNEHPTQAIADAFTLWQLAPKKKWNVVFFGDVARSRVIRSNIYLFRSLGFSMSICDDGSEATRLFARAFELPLLSRKKLSDAEVVMALRVQKERGSEYQSRPLSKAELSPQAYLMHPGPVMLGKDLDYDLCDFSQERILILKQVQNGYLTRRQLLSELFQVKR